MSQIKTTSMEGDVAIGRNLTSGGNATIRGNAVIEMGVRIKGWLDAPNIKGACKGFFGSAEELNEMYPLPQPGWWALVGSFPAEIYRVVGREWKGTGEHVSDITIADEALRAEFERLSGEVDSELKEFERIMGSMVTKDSPQAIQSTYLSYFDELDKSGIDKLSKEGPFIYSVFKDKVSQTGTRPAGIVMLYSNGSHGEAGVLNEMLFTTLMLDEDGNFSGSSEKVSIYHRSYLIGVSDPKWSDWKEIFNADMSSLLESLKNECNNRFEKIDQTYVKQQSFQALQIGYLSKFDKMNAANISSMLRDKPAVYLMCDENNKEQNLVIGVSFFYFSANEEKVHQVIFTSYKLENGQLIEGYDDCIMYHRQINMRPVTSNWENWTQVFSINYFQDLNSQIGKLVKQANDNTKSTEELRTKVERLGTFDDQDYGRLKEQAQNNSDNIDLIKEELNQYNLNFQILQQTVAGIATRLEYVEGAIKALKEIVSKLT